MQRWRDKVMTVVLASEALDLDPTLSISVSFIALKNGWMKQERADAFG